MMRRVTFPHRLPPRRMPALLPLALALAALAPGIAAGEAPVSREQAMLIALDIISPATLDHNVTAFLTAAPLPAGSAIWPFDHEEHQRTITSPTWFCWINDDSQAFFTHPTRFVFIDQMTGLADVRVEGWWPMLNGQELFMSDEEMTDFNLIVYSCIHKESIGGAP